MPEINLHIALRNPAIYMNAIYYVAMERKYLFLHYLAQLIFHNLPAKLYLPQYFMELEKQI